MMMKLEIIIIFNFVLVVHVAMIIHIYMITMTTYLRQKKDYTIDYYGNCKGNNIIHDFTNVQCDHCSDTMNKGYFTMEVIEETEENLQKYSMPNDFIRELKIYNEYQELVQSFEPNDYYEYVELQELSTEKSKKILYCNNCKFIILNNLKKIKVR